MKNNEFSFASSNTTRHKHFDSTELPSIQINLTKLTSVDISSEKLKLSFDKKKLNFKAIAIKNRINKLIMTEKEAVKEMETAKQVAEEVKMKKERNLSLQKEKSIIKQKKLEEKLKLRDQVQEDRHKRAYNIKKYEQEIVFEKQEIAKKIKEAEKQWKSLVEKNKQLQIEEKSKKRNFIRYEHDCSIKKRCISELSNRKKTKYRYQENINSLREEHEYILKTIEKLESEQSKVNQHTLDVVNERNQTFKSLEILIK